MKKESIIPKVVIMRIDSFIDGVDACDRSKQSYKSNITQFFNWVFGNGYDYAKLDRVDVLKYKKALENDAKSPSTIDAYITAVRKYFKWTSALAVSNNNYYNNITDGVSNPKKFRSFGKMPLNLQQATDILNSVDIGTIGGLRDYAIINLMIRTGLRCIEVSRIMINDIKYQSGNRVIYIQGKGHKSKDVYVVLTDDTYASIHQYLESMDVQGEDEPVFKSMSRQNKGKRLTEQSISKVVKEHLIKIGLNDKRYTAHSLRHTAACLLVESGVSLYDVQLYMRHSSPSITEIYTRMIEEQKRLLNVSGVKMDELFKDQVKVHEKRKNEAETSDKEPCDE